MVIPWGTIKSLLLFFGPLLLPRAIAYYRRIQAAAARQQQQRQAGGGGAGVEIVRPLRMRTAVVLAVLAAAAVVSLASTGFFGSFGVLSLLQPENIFVATDSRLQTPTDVLFTRLAARRPGRLLTAADEALRARFASLESRLLYLQYGPDVLAGCPFCAGTGVDGNSDGSISATAYLYYALVDLAAQHLAALVLIAVATSPLVLLGRKGGSAAAAASTSAPTSASTSASTLASAAFDRAYDVAAARVRRWRTPATVAALVLAAADVALLAMHDGRANARATRQSELDFFFWTARRVRGLAGGLLLGGLAAMLYCGATGWAPGEGQGQGQGDGQGQLASLARLLVFGTASTELSPAQRVTGAANGLAAIRSRLNAAAIVKNTALRDVELRARTQAYWAREVALVAEAMEERDVIEGVNDALEHRLDMRQIERDADLYVQNVVPLPPGSGSGNSSSGVA